MRPVASGDFAELINPLPYKSLIQQAIDIRDKLQVDEFTRQRHPSPIGGDELKVATGMARYTDYRDENGSGFLRSGELPRI